MSCKQPKISSPNRLTTKKADMNRDTLPTSDITQGREGRADKSGLNRVALTTPDLPLDVRIKGIRPKTTPF